LRVPGKAATFPGLEIGFVEDAMADSAAKALTEWQTALGDVERRLAAKKGKMPKPKRDPKVSLAKAVALANAIDADAKKLLTAIKEYQTHLSNVEGDCDDYARMIERSDFGLTKGQEEDQRIINFATVTLPKCLDGIALGSRSPRKAAQKIRDALEGADLKTF
jgi:hypothetical protein